MFFISRFHPEAERPKDLKLQRLFFLAVFSKICYSYIMQSKKLRKSHIESFAKLTLSERFSWIFTQYEFLTRFMRPEIKQINRTMRRHGKKYFGD